jgi:hypothetical protein
MKKARPVKKSEPSGTLPMDLRVGDRLGDKTGEWEVIGLPYTTTGGRIVHARAQRIDQPASWEIRNWDALKRISVTRDSSRD